MGNKIMNEQYEPEILKINLDDKLKTKLLAHKRVFIFFMAFLFFIISIAFNFINRQEVLADKQLSQTEKWPISFRDYFESDSPEQLEYWRSTDGTSSEKVSGPISKDGRLQVSVAPTESDTVREAFYNEFALAPRNFLLSVELINPAGCNTGLIFRGNIKGEYYLFLVGSHTYTVEILQRDAGSDLPRQAIISNTDIPERIGQPHKLSVLSDGQNYYFYINNSFVNEIHDSRLSGERTGIEIMVCHGFSTESNFVLDNFTLKTPYIAQLGREGD
jgi:hypothetical protein